MPEIKTKQSIGGRIGSYEIIRKIGEGGLAEIFLASQKSLNRYVAVKVLHPHISRNHELVRRFERESLTLAKLSHPNIVHIIDRGTDKDRFYFVMEYVEGTDFRQLINSTDFSRHQKLNVVVQLLKGLDYAHKNGIIHRDVKPANILVDREGHALIADFGISQLLEVRAGDHTEAGMVLGTYAYMSPEQKEDSSDIDHTTDIYAVGLILYEALTGKRPMGRFKLPSQLINGLSDAYDAIVVKALQQNPAERYQKAVEMKDDLLAAMHNDGKRIRSSVGATRRTRDFIGNCSFLDTLQDSRFSSTYLVEERRDRALFVIKKQSKPGVGLAEARLLANLRHPNILPLHGAGSDDQKLVIIMDYAQGGSLADRMVKATAWRDALRIMKQIAAGMDFAHKNNVIHGNLKPTNILFDKDEVVKIADFSLLSHLDRRSGNPCAAPERRKSRAGDVYSAGVVFYRLLTNRVPTADTSGRFLWVDSHRAIPEQLKELIANMLKNRPSERIQSFAEIQEQLSEIGAEEPVHLPTVVESGKSRLGWASLLSVAAFLLLATLLILYFTNLIN